jgi:hypothetical protein
MVRHRGGMDMIATQHPLYVLLSIFISSQDGVYVIVLEDVHGLCWITEFIFVMLLFPA